MKQKKIKKSTTLMLSLHIHYFQVDTTLEQVDLAGIRRVQVDRS